MAIDHAAGAAPATRDTAIRGSVATADLLAALAWVAPFVQRDAESRPYLGCVHLRVLPGNLLRLEACNAFQLARAEVPYASSQHSVPGERGDYLLQPRLMKPELFFGVPKKKLWTPMLPFVLAATGPHGTAELGNAMLEGQPGTYPNTDQIMPKAAAVFSIRDTTLLKRAANTAIAAEADALMLELQGSFLQLRMPGAAQRDDLVWKPYLGSYSIYTDAVEKLDADERYVAYRPDHLLALCRASERGAKLARLRADQLTFCWPTQHPGRSATRITSALGTHVIMPKLP